MPKTKTITVRRHQNLGDYSNRTVEETIELNEGEDPEVEWRNLQLRLEREIFNDVVKIVQKEIGDLRTERSQLREEVYQTREQLQELKTIVGKYKQLFMDIFELDKGEQIDDDPTLIVDREQQTEEALAAYSSDLMIQDHPDDEEDDDDDDEEY